MNDLEIEQASIDDLVTVAGEHEPFWGERDLAHLHHVMLVHQFGRTGLLIRGERGEVIAYLFGLVTPEGVGYIHLVAVREGHRRGGLAEALYEEFERRAQGLGASTLAAFTSLANDTSVAFHTAFGFTARETPGYVGEGETRIVFHKQLGEPVRDATWEGLELGDGISLRPIELEDIDELHALITANSDHLRPWLPFADQPLERTQGYVQRCVRAAAAGEGLNLALCDGGRLIGMVSFVDPSREHRLTSIGYWLAKGAEGRGIMTRAVDAVVEEAFAAWELERVEIRVAAENARSRAIPERLGFRKEGELRRAHSVAGVSHEEIVYGLLKADRDAGG